MKCRCEKAESRRRTRGNGLQNSFVSCLAFAWIAARITIPSYNQPTSITRVLRPAQATCTEDGARRAGLFLRLEVLRTFSHFDAQVSIPI